MSWFSYEFFIFLIVGCILFYAVKQKIQWIILLLLSLYFYGRSIGSFPVILLGVSIITHLGVRYIGKGNERLSKYLKRGIIMVDLILLIFGRTTNYFAMLGNSYFTLKAIGYVIDVEREQAECEENYFRFLLYLIFFPAVSQGPFNRYRSFWENFKEKIVFNYTMAVHGIQRFLWGAFKKLVISERIGFFVNYVYGDLDNAAGLMIILAACGYAIWIYTDFAGYMDMMLGISEVFGISLPENFNRPYFSTSVSEFWRRWHITLGYWFRDYVMYSFVMSKCGRKLGKAAKAKLGKKAGKLITPIVGTMLVWICTGLWHGLNSNYLIWGIYYGVIISLSLILEDYYKKVKNKCHIKDESLWYKIFCTIRTWIVVLFADIVICTENVMGLKIALQRMVYNFADIREISLSRIGYQKRDVIILFVSCMILLIVSILQEKGQDIRRFLDGRNIVVRWSVYYLLLFSVLLFGMYGAGYDASAFLYAGF